MQTQEAMQTQKGTALENKVAVVTGGNSGIGRAIAERFAREGAEVVIFGRSQDTIDETARALSNGALAVQGDVQRLDDLDRLFAEVKARHGRIDVLVANAGGGTVRPLEAEDEAHFDEVVDTNFKGAFFTVQKALELLADGGSGILVSSVSHQKGFPGFGVYGAAKAAVRNLARAFAAELAPRGIRVNALSPGPIDTPGFGRLGLPEKQLQEARDGFTAQVPLGRMGTAEEMAGAAFFLASADAAFVTGADLTADGGLTQV
jgi:NAD(P)-dependent dehydrogenase (short-subunit alcohol dehydrogenase family)